jgi:hypothetical protein
MKQLLIALSFVLPSFAFAAADCPEYPKSEWMSVFDLQKMIVNEYGFAIKLFKVDDECYEIYGWELDENGEEKKIEVYFDAKTGEIVKKEDD